MAVKYKTVGFGYDPADVYSHFLVDIPKDTKEPVRVFERVVWDDNEKQTSDLNNCKIELSQKTWRIVKSSIEKEFNRLLKENRLLVGHFKGGTQVPVCRLLGKELLVLLWAVERAETNEQIHCAVCSWLGLSREERWWLFTMINASCGKHSDHKGWRVAIFYALADTAPVGNVMKQLHLNM